MKEASLQETVVENVFLMVSGDLHALVESASLLKSFYNVIILIIYQI